MQRLGLPDSSDFWLPPEELTVLPYRLDLKQCDDLYCIHNLHHIYKHQCAAKSLAQVREIGRGNSEVDDGILRKENIKLKLPVVRRTSRV